MDSRKLRTVAVLAASSALAIATIAPSVAQEAPPPGIGSSSGAASLLTLSLGTDALGLRVVGEDSQTTNDPGAGGPSALERVSPLQVSSSLLPALDAVSQPTVETRSTSGENATSTPAVDLGALVADAPVPGLLTGTIDPIGLRSAVDANGAVSTATGTIRDLAVFGGVLRAGTLSTDLGSSALVSDAGSVRGLQLDSLEVLDLTALLDLLGLSLGDLPIDVAVGLLDGLGLPLPGGLSREALLATIDGLLAQTSSVRAQVTTLQGQIDDLQADQASLTSQLSDATAQVASLTSELAAQQALLAACGGIPLVCDPIQAQVTALTAQLATATASVASIDAAIDTIQAQIETLLDQIEALLATIRGALDELLGLLDAVLDGLDGATLLTVEDLVVGLTARADNTLDTSAASVVGSVGAVRIGGLSLGGLDAGATSAQLTALADQVNSTLGGILSVIDPSLGDLVDIDLLAQATSVTEDAGVTEASAAITGLRASITPPDLCSVLLRLGAVTDTLGTVLDGLGSALPSLPGPVSEVLSDLGSTVTCNAAASTVNASGLVNGVAAALTQPLTVEALNVAGAGTFAAPFTPGTPGTPGELPATGGNERLALLALGLGAVGFATRRLLVRCS